MTLAVMIAVLAAVDLLVGRTFASPPPFTSFYRFPETLTANQFERQLQSIKEADGIRVAFIGDSTVRGAAVPENSQTIPAYLQQLINSDSELSRLGIKVFNFGIAGAREADKYAVLKTLADYQVVDLLVMNISYPFFSDEILKTKVLFPKAYPDLFSPEEKAELGLTGQTGWGASPPPAAGEENDEPAGGVAGAPAGGPSLEDLLTQKLMGWQLYKYREEVNRYLFGETPAVAGKKLLDRVLAPGRTAGHEETGKTGADTAPAAENGNGPETGGTLDGVELAAKDRPENLYKVYDQFPWEDPEIDHLKKVFRVREIDEDNIGFRYLKKSVELADTREIPALYYLTPVNFALLHRYQVLDEADWQADTGKLLDFFRSRKALCLDLQDKIDDQCFHDSLHMVVSGNRKTAELILAELKPVLLRLQETTR